jgi:hypothetical protein
MSSRVLKRPLNFLASGPKINRAVKKAHYTVVQIRLKGDLVSGMVVHKIEENTTCLLLTPSRLDPNNLRHPKKEIMALGAQNSEKIQQAVINSIR